MHTSKFRPIFELASVNKNCTRSVSAPAEKVLVNKTSPLKSWREIPGPTSLPIIGPMHHFFPGGMYHKLSALALFDKFHETYGPIVRLEATIGRVPMIILFDAESVSQVLRGENWFPVRPGFESLDYYRLNLKKGVKKGRPNGLGTDHKDLWKELRSMVNPVLLQPKTINLYAGILEDVAVDMIARIKSQRDEKNMLKSNLYDEMNRWALESIGTVALGCRLGCLDPNLPLDSTANQLVKCVRELFILSWKLDYSPSIWKIVSTPNFKRAMVLYEQQESLSKIFINQATQEFKKMNKSEDEKGVLEKLLDIDVDVAIIMASDLLFGGVDTAANTIIAALYLLAKNPEKQNKLREELLTNDERKLYHKAVLKEAIRMMPVSLGNLRISTKEYNLLGYKIPSNTRFVFAHHNMSLMEKYFPRSKEFLPERWLVDKDDPLHYKHGHPFAHSPFGFGVRSCIGRRIAELEMEILVANLVENFQIEWCGPPPKIEQSTLNHVKGPYNFIFKDAK